MSATSLDAAQTTRAHSFAAHVHLRRAALPALAFVALVLAGCGGHVTTPAATSDSASSVSSAATSFAPVTPGPLTFSDDLGRTVEVDNPQRVVVGMGSLADIWRDAGGTAVGLSDDSFDNYGFDHSQADGVGRHVNLNLEAILALNPDLVILTAKDDSASSGPSQAQLHAALEQADVPTAFFSVATFDDYLHTLHTFTQITGRLDLYERNGVQVQQRVKQVLDTYGPRVAATSPRVLVVSASSKGVSAQDPSHMASQMLEQLGATLLTQENPSLLSDFSIEAVVELNPDYIFVLPAASDNETAQRYVDAVEQDQAWQQIPAVAEGHVNVLDMKHFFLKPNAEWDQAFETLGQALTTNSA